MKSRIKRPCFLFIHTNRVMRRRVAASPCPQETVRSAERREGRFVAVQQVSVPELAASSGNPARSSRFPELAVRADA
jgi:hypothetical protein